MEPGGATVGVTPKLRFPEFRDADGWEAKLGHELFDQINSRQATAGLPILAITQEHGAIPREAIDYHVSVTEKSVEAYKEVQPGDFIISLRSFQGGIEYSNCHGICSPAYVILRRKAQLSDLFFKHLFKSQSFIQALTRNLEGLRDGKMISYKQFSELLLPYPTLPEQQRIAECLNSLDELIVAQARKLDTLKAHKTGLVQQFLPRKGETQPRLRFSEFRDAGEWRMRRLGDLLDDVIDFRGRTPAKLGMEWGNGDITSLSANNVKNGFIDYSAECNLGSEELYSRWMGDVSLEEEDIVFTMEAPLGNALLLPDSRKYILSQRVVAFKTKAEVLNRFLVQVIWGESFQSELDKLATGSTAKGINQKALKTIPVRLPDRDEQKKIADCLSNLDSLLVAQTEKLNALKTHKKGLMQQLFPSLEKVEA